MTVSTTADPLFALPPVPWARDALDFVFGQESASVAHHSARSWLFARLLAEHDGLTGEVDDALLFAATVLHDIGLRRDTRAPVRFEVDGADAAAEFLTGHGLAAPAVDLVWEAIALHTSPGIAERRGPLAYLVREGVGIDFGRMAHVVDDARAAAVHAAHPRLDMVHSLVDDIVAQVRAVPERGPRFSIAGELARERAVGPVTAIELAAASSRWGS